MASVFGDLHEEIAIIAEDEILDSDERDDATDLVSIDQIECRLECLVSNELRGEHLMYLTHHWYSQVSLLNLGLVYKTIL